MRLGCAGTNLGGGGQISTRSRVGRARLTGRARAGWRGDDGDGGERGKTRGGGITYGLISLPTLKVTLCALAYAQIGTLAAFGTVMGPLLPRIPSHVLPSALPATQRPVCMYADTRRDISPCALSIDSPRIDRRSRGGPLSGGSPSVQPGISEYRMPASASSSSS